MRTDSDVDGEEFRMDKHSVASLRYRMFFGPVDLTPLRVIADREARWRGWRVRMSILAASHAVELSRGGDAICELLTCAPPGGLTQSIAERIPGHSIVDWKLHGL